MCLALLGRKPIKEKVSSFLCARLVFFVFGLSHPSDLAMFVNRRNPKKKIKAIQKAIDGFNKGLEGVRQLETYYLDQAARDLEKASLYGEKDKSFYLQLRESSLQDAKYYTDFQLRYLEEIASLQTLQNREIEALQHGASTKQKTWLHFCLFF
ncbi:PREDICTED: uncharacterized protein LOC104766089 [Camelina sativa]|uniref:Uncharacterized protein LOC104766089 n=1 Tax=Camelina sativa TaxID=90675 RepID=A0ABM0XMP8_CAMSA|nr:PREDICTED: uncharacterized protein LOC104766089 [Camelina sativa]